MKTLDLTGCGSWEPGLDLTPCSGGAAMPFDCSLSVWGIDGVLYQEGGVWSNPCPAFYDVVPLTTTTPATP